VLKGGVGGENGVVGLNNSSGHLRSRVDREFQLGLLAIVHRQALHQEGSEARASASSEGVEDEETLKTSALLRQLSDSVQNKVNNFLANGVVATSVIVSGILLAGDQLFRMEELAVGSHADLINDSGLEINKDSPGNVLAAASFGEEGVEGIVMSSNSLVRWHLSIRLDSVLKTVELPASIANLATSLADMDGDALAHFSTEFSDKISFEKRFKVVQDTAEKERETATSARWKRRPVTER